ncbi:hypothetical protein CERZMDRAFT_9323, partial [Cercospora zeae-maydis SCOH1-5]
VTVNNLSKTSNSTGGSGSVSAAGTLAGFGGIGVGCGINWNDDVSYGGGLQSGSKDFGLGGGFTITPTQLNVSAGIGINPANASGNFVVSATTDGKFVFEFDASSAVVCVQDITNGRFKINCMT